jgi:ATP-dependent DNA ligase
MPLPSFIAPCLPTKAKQPPRGEAWLHEIKHDGFRVIARKDGKRVKLYSRPGNDLTYRFPLRHSRSALPVGDHRRRGGRVRGGRRAELRPHPLPAP